MPAGVALSPGGSGRRQFGDINVNGRTQWIVWIADGPGTNQTVGSLHGGRRLCSRQPSCSEAGFPAIATQRIYEHNEMTSLLDRPTTAVSDDGVCRWHAAKLWQTRAKSLKSNSICILVAQQVKKTC